ncbi:MlaD family protein [Mycolicibacterium sp. A43C]
MQPMKILGNQLLWGLLALGTVLVVAVAATVVYVSPPGEKDVVFYTDDAASVRSGVDVRIAGITVGRVKDLAIEPDRVRVHAVVDRDAFVGDQSQVQVRMLTVVGGYYVNIVSLGEQPLGAQSIPIERVTMPYNLMQTLADATKVTDHVDPRPIRESLDQIETGLQGANVDTLSAIIDAGSAITATIDRQRGQITSILDLSDEYIQSLRNYRGQLQQLVSKIAILEQTLVLYGKAFGDALSGMGDIADSFLGPFGRFWVNHREDFIDKVRSWQERFRRWADNNSRIIPRLRRVRDKLERVLDAQNARPELLATDLCIPMPGSGC